tara:strand:+ start:50 stop:571 length:522 start_codon:yes stop_codon:yes gene_type:complete
MENKIEVIDNFLPDYCFKHFQSILLGEEFPWYYSDHINHPQKGKNKFYQFYHRFYDKKLNCQSSYMDERGIRDILNLCGEKLNSNNLHRIKANLRPRSFFNRSGGEYHIDGYDCSHTSIYYINTNNGYTKFKNGTKIKSVENRMVVFPSHLEHQGYTCSDKLKRVVVNFNYDK